jgi:hypothetical protein
MLLHHEGWWLALYLAVVVAALIAAILSGLAVWSFVAIAVGGPIVAFYGWLFQVGRFG